MDPTEELVAARMTGEAHPLADLFPLMDGDAFEELKADILANGLFMPVIVTPSGLILDGRNRYRACRALQDSRGEAPVPDHARLRVRVVRFEDNKQREVVMSLNAKRRHMTTSQRAMTAARWAKFSSLSQRGRADALGVSVATLKHAEAVLTSGDRALIASVDSGAVAVSDAAKRLKPPTPKTRPAPMVEAGPELDKALGRFADAIVEGRRPAEPPVSGSDTLDMPGLRVPGPSVQQPDEEPVHEEPAVKPIDWSGIAYRLNLPSALRQETRGLPHEHVLQVTFHALSQGLTPDELTMLLNKAKQTDPATAQAWARRVVMGQ